jgi:hypothetical protein
VRPYSNLEIAQRAKTLYDRMVGGDSLRNTEKIIKGVSKLLKAEKQRRKQLEKRP